MGNIMDKELHLPWDNNSLEKLLLKIVQTGETAKVDFKQTLNFDTAEQKAELLKDISAFANTYDDAYYDHGFIIVGVKQNQLIGTAFPQKDDNIQSQIDELIKNYIGPFIKTHVRIFNTENKTWGVIVIPPTRNAPHVFIRDIHNKHRGDIYIRRGTVTDKALPDDFTRFFRHHFDEYTYELRQEIKNIQSKLEEITKDLIVRETNKSSVTPGKDADKVIGLLEQKGTLHRKKTTTLLHEIENAFVSEEDPVKDGLIKEARKVQFFLESNSIPWDLQVRSKEEGQKLFSAIEKETETYWMALSKILLRDDKEKYDEAIIRSIGCLARYYEAPNSITYTNLGENIRYYPLIVSLYIIFMICAFKKKQSLLKAITGIELLRRSLYEESYPIAYSLFFIRRAGEVFQTQHENYPNSQWCDSVASYIKNLLERKIHIDDCLWHKDANFYIGEFLLSLLPLDIVDKNTGTPAIGHPSSGLFIYISDSIPVIRRFLKYECNWIAKIFHRPFENILREFDETAKKLATGLCRARGFVSGSFESAFSEKTK